MTKPAIVVLDDELSQRAILEALKTHAESGWKNSDFYGSQHSPSTLLRLTYILCESLGIPPDDVTWIFDSLGEDLVAEFKALKAAGKI